MRIGTLAAAVLISLAISTCGYYRYMLVQQTHLSPTTQSQLVLAIEPARNSVSESKRTRPTSKKKKPPTLLKSVLARSKKKAIYLVPTATELREFESRMIDTLSLDSSAIKEWPAIERRWNQAGWEIHRDAHSDYIVIAEHPIHLRGRGTYALRLASQSKIVLQAPHRFFDRRTGRIVSDSFQQFDIRAAAWNTVHREQVDLCHVSTHFLNAFTRAMLMHDYDIRTIQIHGFASKTKKGVAKTAAAIVSDSTNFPGRWARNVAIKMKQKFGTQHTRLYPLEIRELGGTQNTQANLLRSMGSSQFLHIEMNEDFRKALDNSASTRRQLFESISVYPTH